MTDQLQVTAIAESEWRELRDASGKLWGRLEERLWLLEVRSKNELVVFDLRDYLATLDNEEFSRDD